MMIGKIFAMIIAASIFGGAAMFGSTQPMPAKAGFAGVSITVSQVSTPTPPPLVVGDNKDKQVQGTAAVNLDGPGCTLLTIPKMVNGKAVLDKDGNPVVYGGAEGFYTQTAKKPIHVKNSLILMVMKDVTGANVWSTAQIYFQDAMTGVNGAQFWVYWSVDTINSTDLKTLNGVCHWTGNAKLVADLAGQPYHFDETGIVWETPVATEAAVAPKIDTPALLLDPATGAQVGG